MTWAGDIYSDVQTAVICQLLERAKALPRCCVTAILPAVRVVYCGIELRLVALSSSSSSCAIYIHIGGFRSCLILRPVVSLPAGQIDKSIVFTLWNSI